VAAVFGGAENRSLNFLFKKSKKEKEMNGNGKITVVPKPDLMIPRGRPHGRSAKAIKAIAMLIASALIVGAFWIIFGPK
jgi:hypothetical protein